MKLSHRELDINANKGFSSEEKSLMASLSGVGPKVIERLEQVGFYRLAQLRGEDACEVTKRIAKLFESTCWKNSPQARKAIQAVIDLANER